MSYNKDSGESKLRKNVNTDAYNNKKNKNIFKNSQASQSPLKPQNKANYNWEIPDVDVDVEQHEPRSFYEYERQRRNQSESGESKQELLSFRDVIGIIVANGIVPIVGGFVYYIILSSKGEKQKAAQSIVLSAVISVIRIIYLVNN
jgi:hypothetical protein